MKWARLWRGQNVYKAFSFVRVRLLHRRTPNHKHDLFSCVVFKWARHFTPILGAFHHSRQADKNGYNVVDTMVNCSGQVFHPEGDWGPVLGT